MHLPLIQRPRACLRTTGLGRRDGVWGDLQTLPDLTRPEFGCIRKKKNQMRIGHQPALGARPHDDQPTHSLLACAVAHRQRPIREAEIRREKVWRETMTEQGTHKLMLEVEAIQGMNR